ncbi:MAG: hypothetical protein P8X61_03015 [Limibacillus sp.]
MTDQKTAITQGIDQTATEAADSVLETKKRQRPRGRRHRWFARRIKYPLEALAFFLLLRFFGLLPLDWASRFGGWAGGILMPHFGTSKRALRNLRLIYPSMPEALRRQIVKDMWRDFGAVAAEYAHLDEITDLKNGRVTLVGTEAMRRSIEAGHPAILASGHFSNFEVMHIVMARVFKKVSTVVRQPNNKLIEDELERIRSCGGGRRLAKGRVSARSLLMALEEGDTLGILVDQKLTRGVESKFLGHPAMTPTAAAAMAIRLNRPIYIAHIKRKGPGRFELAVEGPLVPDCNAPRNEEIKRLTQALNDKLGEYILEHPPGWLWLHRRWPEEVYQKAGV